MKGQGQLTQAQAREIYGFTSDIPLCGTGTAIPGNAKSLIQFSSEFAIVIGVPPFHTLAGLFENNTIYNNTMSNIKIEEGAVPVIKNNYI